MSHFPLVTIGIPTYNRSAYLRQALESALAQTYPHLEIIVSDNASTDDTPQVVAGYTDPRIRYIRQNENLGMAGNWNACLRHSSAEYFLLLSDDDLLLPQGVEKLLKAFLAEQQIRPVSFCYGYARRFGDLDATTDRLVLEPGPRRESWLSFVENHYKRHISLCGTLHKVNNKSKLRGYAESYKLLSDVHFSLSEVLTKRADVIYLYEEVALYRVHSSSETVLNGKIRWIAEYIWLLDLCLQRLEALLDRDPSPVFYKLRLRKFGLKNYYAVLSELTWMERIRVLFVSAIENNVRLTDFAPILFRTAVPLSFRGSLKSWYRKIVPERDFDSSFGKSQTNASFVAKADG